MANISRNLLRALCIIPFSAGYVKERRNGDYSRHDGSIAGTVLLTTAVIILEIIGGLPITTSRKVMIVLACLSIIVLIFVSLATALCNNWRTPLERKSTDKLQLGFLWLFCVGNVIYQAIDLAQRITCKIYDTYVVMFCASNWIFHFLQTIFIQHYSKFKFSNVLYWYYVMVILFITNISLWT